jgi:type VI secretion system secreted protein Hcp
MAVDAFLKLGKVNGESIDAKHKDWIQILSWSWGATNHGSAGTGTGGGTGKVNVQDISITKVMDTSSPLLLKAVTLGEHYDTGQIVVRKASGGKEPLPYLTIDLKEVFVTSYHVGHGGGDEFTDQITLNFGEFKLTYQAQDKTGAKKGGPVDFGYNIAETNTK